MPYGLSYGLQVSSRVLSKMYYVISLESVSSWSTHPALKSMSPMSRSSCPASGSISCSLKQRNANSTSKITVLGYVISATGDSMDQDKITAFTTWPFSTSVKELLHFLGFTNFYWHFILHFNTIAVPLNALLTGAPEKLSWNRAAKEAFAHLQKTFLTAPVLKHPDPSQQFTVETTRIGQNKERF